MLLLISFKGCPLLFSMYSSSFYELLFFADFWKCNIRLPDNDMYGHLLKEWIASMNITVCNVWLHFQFSNICSSALINYEIQHILSPLLTLYFYYSWCKFYFIRLGKKRSVGNCCRRIVENDGGNISWEKKQKS